jgi:hypothetical protein
VNLQTYFGLENIEWLGLVKLLGNKKIKISLKIFISAFKYLFEDISIISPLSPFLYQSSTIIQNILTKNMKSKKKESGKYSKFIAYMIQNNNNIKH